MYVEDIVRNGEDFEGIQEKKKPGARGCCGMVTRKGAGLEINNSFSPSLVFGQVYVIASRASN
jgi:hypothetical protein